MFAELERTSGVCFSFSHTNTHTQTHLHTHMQILTHKHSCLHKPHIHTNMKTNTCTVAVAQHVNGEKTVTNMFHPVAVFILPICSSLAALFFLARGKQQATAYLAPLPCLAPFALHLLPSAFMYPSFTPPTPCLVY